MSADLSEVRHLIVGMQRDFGRMEGKIDGIVARLDSGTRRMDTIEARQSKTEKKVHFFSGIYAAFGAVGGWFIKSHSGT